MNSQRLGLARRPRSSAFEFGKKLAQCGERCLRLIDVDVMARVLNHLQAPVGELSGKVYCSFLAQNGALRSAQDQRGTRDL